MPNKPVTTALDTKTGSPNSAETSEPTPVEALQDITNRMVEGQLGLAISEQMPGIDPDRRIALRKYLRMYPDWQAGIRTQQFLRDEAIAEQKRLDQVLVDERRLIQCDLLISLLRACGFTTVPSKLDRPIWTMDGVDFELAGGPDHLRIRRPVNGASEEEYTRIVNDAPLAMQSWVNHMYRIWVVQDLKPLEAGVDISGGTNVADALDQLIEASMAAAERNQTVREKHAEWVAQKQAPSARDQLTDVIYRMVEEAIQKRNANYD